MAKIVISIADIGGKIGVDVRKGTDENDTPELKKAALAIMSALPYPVAAALEKAFSSTSTTTTDNKGKSNVH
ncbi:hypothetical protein TUM17576_43530 [Enterobacter hormaechei]|nr:hypothetical protein [Enterobacter hormaechei]GJL37533.1 hypothetical protein TUM17576_43530 [Enterobacter hormaechei]